MAQPRKALPILLLACVFAFPVAIGLIIAPHYGGGDEVFTIRSLRQTIETQTILPNRYTYPSMTYNIALAAFAPPALAYVWENWAEILSGSGETLLAEAQRDLIALVESDAYQDMTRQVFTIINYLTLIWVYLLVRRWRKGAAEALIAAGLLAVSWEISQHAHWILPNALMMQFGALSLMWIAYGLTAEQPRRAALYLRLAVIAAGLACSSKYQGGLLLLFVWAAAAVVTRPKSLRDLPWSEWLRLGVLFTAAFLITTPGALLQPTLFARGVRYEIVHYSVVGHNAHNVTPGIEHFALNWGYLGLAALSRYPLIGAALSGLALIGAGAVIARDRRMALILIGFPLLFVLYMSAQRVMFTRNLLLLIPIMAILAARGAGVLAALIGRLARSERIGMGAVAAAIAGLSAINAAWLIESSAQVLDPPEVTPLDQIVTYLEAPGAPVYISAGVAALLDEAGVAPPPRAVRALSEAERVLFLAGELRDALRPSGQFIPINRPGYFEYLPPYPYWGNPDYADHPPNRPLIVSRERFESFGGVDF